jgi:hypothetical protein
MYEIPKSKEGIKYICRNIKAWCKLAIESAKNNYDCIT